MDMLKMRKLPIGIQGFMGLRNDGYLYVDKTDYVYKLVSEGKQYFLSRPRRFGKSLFISTLKTYWEGKKEYFKGLAIEKLEEGNGKAWQPYPVFHFDFTGSNYQEDHALEKRLDEHLRRWEKCYEVTPRPEDEIGARFRNILLTAEEKTGRQCVILVDEYDKPLLEVMENPERLEHSKAVFKGFFGTLKGFDEHLRFVFITGVTKFSKVSIFSDLNQLNDISMNEDYAGICGITEAELYENFAPEIRAMAERRGLTVAECREKLRKQYDGYHFCIGSEGIYNPFSVLKAFFDRNFGPYWFATGTPTFLTSKLKSVGFDARKFKTNNLFVGESAISDYRAEDPDPLPLLYQTGYLTLEGFDENRRRFQLRFPNQEVECGLLESLLPAYVPTMTNANGTDIFTLDDCLESGDVEGAMDVLTAIFAGIAYTEERNPFEHYFQTVIYLIFTLLGKFTVCEMHTARGRIDCTLETEEYVYLFEFKRDDTAEKALNQIEEKGYADRYAADKRKLYKIGVAFDSEKRILADWQIEE